MGLKYRLEVQSKAWEVDRKKLTVTKVFEANVIKYPNKTCILFEEEIWTFKRVGFFHEHIESEQKVKSENNCFYIPGFQISRVKK
jgi:hypothetical protein